ncbi:hypothetical protein D910_06121 [Dendroctonus ponderosae]|uniref:Uncharacterized protein n=1 Tax=Dendroctonus ponderosae TaxID=77166 RepID=U4U4A7_DENPD|nr:hypothetical protein D910_06121 [Dendroctonus ponderosae]
MASCANPTHRHSNSVALLINRYGLDDKTVVSVIARLFGSLLYKLKLRVLRIEETPLEIIDEFSFLGVNNTLNELHIVNSSLLELPLAAFKVRRFLLWEATVCVMNHIRQNTGPPSLLREKSGVFQWLRQRNLFAGTY